jgi:PHD-finger
VSASTLWVIASHMLANFVVLSSYRYDLEWDNISAAEKGCVDDNDPMDAVHYSKKEEVLVRVAKEMYNFAALDEIVKTIIPMNGSDWTDEMKIRFNQEIFRARKDMDVVSKAMGIPMKVILAYYLGTFKKSDNYRLLKTVITDERMAEKHTWEFGYDSCAVCGDGGSLVICDGCEGEYHLSCLKPPLRSVPDGHWECDECVDNKLIAARNYIITKSTLYEHFDVKKRKAEEMKEDGTKAEEMKIIDVKEEVKEESKEEGNGNDNDSDGDIDAFRPNKRVLSILERFCEHIKEILEKPVVVKSEGAEEEQQV